MKYQYQIVSSIQWFYRRLNRYSLLAFAGFAGPFVLGLTDMTAALGAPGYDYVRDSISSLALTDVGYIQTIGFLAIGLLVEIFVAGLLYSIRASRGFHLAIALLVVFGFTLLLVGAFHTDPTGTEVKSTEGIIHGVAAMTGFWMFPLAVLVISGSIKRDPEWARLYRYTVIAGILGIVLAIVTAAIKDHITWFGLLERILVGNMIIWVAVAAFRMLCLSVRRSSAS